MEKKKKSAVSQKPKARALQEGRSYQWLDHRWEVCYRTSTGKYSRSWKLRGPRGLGSASLDGLVVK